MGFAKNWKRASDSDKKKATQELRNFGLDDRQIKSLIKFKGLVSELDLILMRDLPSSSRGRRPTISVVKDAVRSCITLGLVHRSKIRRL